MGISKKEDNGSGVRKAGKLSIVIPVFNEKESFPKTYSPNQEIR